MVFSQEISSLEQKMEHVVNVKKETNKVNERIGFHYLLIKILLGTFILLELNIFHKKY